jgi:hypothetical protein
MCDSGCADTFTSNKVTVKNGLTTVLDGTLYPDSGLWQPPFSDTAPSLALPQHMAHNVYEQKSIQDTIGYLHAFYFSPVQDTWIKAISNGHFMTWPALTVDNVYNYLPKSDAMVKGHMNQIRENISSTQPKVMATVIMCMSP